MNMIKTYFSILLFFLISSSVLFAQGLRGSCGMYGEDLALQDQRARTLINSMRTSPLALKRSGETIYVPIKFHLVADSDGNGRILDHFVLEQLCYLNEAFIDYDVQFYIKDNEFSYLNENTIYNNPNATGSEIRMNSNRDREALNLFITKLADTPGGVGTTLGYYTRRRDWVVLRMDQFSRGYTLTIGHEIGHFLSLIHPFNGWDDDPYDAAKHGNPMLLLTKNGVNVELVDRSNCEDSGDYLCDTPTDYLFGFGWGDCNYTREVRDRNNDLIDPMENNFMGYFLSCEDFSYIMTEEQGAQMLADLDTDEREYLFSSSFEPLSEETGTTYLINPPNNKNLTQNEFVEFDWSDALGCNNYLLQISETNSFEANRIVYSSFHTVSWAKVEELPANTTMYWRVIPINEYATCFDFSNVGVNYDRFSTGLGTDVVELLGGSKVEIFSNMIRSGAFASLEISSTKLQTFAISISDIQGRLISETTFNNGLGKNLIQIDKSSELTSGLYFVSVRTDNEIATFKLYVL